MRYIIGLFVITLTFVSIANAQDSSREQKLQKIDALNNQIKVLETEILLPDIKDSNEAEKKGFEVFRLMPRERYDHKLTVRGGGAYYSFSSKSHDYQSISQISLEQNHLSVGFAGADYGFIADLGILPLATINKETYGAAFLANYKPPRNMIEIRSEQRQAHGYQIGDITYKRYLPAIVGSTYVLRSISFDEVDVLVAFKIHRKDTDGSLIIFWKMLKEFEKPTIDRVAEN
jgi:hypothetical protein